MSISKFLKETLRSLTLQQLPLISPQGIESLLSNCSKLKELSLLRCKNGISFLSSTSSTAIPIPTLGEGEELTDNNNNNNNNNSVDKKEGYNRRASKSLLNSLSLKYPHIQQVIYQEYDPNTDNPDQVILPQVQTNQQQQQQ